MKDLSDYLITLPATMRDVLEVIDRGSAQIALVVDDCGHLLGTVTDGDFRRAFLRGSSMETSVEQIMHREFRFLNTTASEEDAMKLMRNEVIHQIPVLDDSGRVIRLFLLEELIKLRERPNPVVIMAGGKGERLKPLTKDCPKPMLQVGGKPILEIILEQCIEAGFCEFYFAVNYLKQQIQDYFGDGSRWQVQIRYLEEKMPLGTAGALSLLPARPSEPLLVLNGDVLTRVDYARLLNFHYEHNSIATLCVREHTTQIPYGVVRMDDLNILSFEEKPVLSHYVNAGIYFIEPSLLDNVPHDCFFDMPQLLECAVKQQQRVSAFPVHEYWLDVGLPEALERAHGEWK